MYPRSFLCEEAKIKQRTSLKKELCEIGEEAIWESRFTSFFLDKISNEKSPSFIFYIIIEEISVVNFKWIDLVVFE